MAALQRAPAKRRFKRVLVVRQLAAQTAWLNASPRWLEGRVRWPINQINQICPLTPGTAELAAAERALNKIANYPRALEMAFRDEKNSGAQWLAQRRAQLEIVKVLARLDAPDLPLLARPSHARNPATLKRLLDLLPAEALCINALPVSPAAILRHWPDNIATPLIEFCNSKNLQPAVRVLVVLILGARGEKQNEISEKTLRAAWQWGHDFGVSQAPGLMARLLAEENSDALATRFINTLPATQKLNFTPDFWGELFSWQSASSVVDLMVAIVSCEAIAAQLRHSFIIQGQSSKPQLSPQLQATFAQLQNKQNAIGEGFLRLLQEFARDGDAVLIENLRDFALALLELETPLAIWASPPPEWQLRRGNPLLWPLLHQQVSKHILFVLREVKNRAPEKRGAAFRLLREEMATIWDAETLSELQRKHDLSKQTKNWLHAGWNWRGQRILQLISRVEEQTARRALELKVTDRFFYHEWRDTALAQWALDLAERFATESCGPEEHLGDICDLLVKFPNLASARAELGAILDVLRGHEATSRAAFFRGIMIYLDWTDKSQRNTARLRLYLDVIARLAPTHQSWQIARFTDATMRLDKEMRRAARENFLAQEAKQDEEIEVPFEDNLSETTRFLNAMVDDILRTLPQNEDENDPVVYYYLETATLLSWILSDGDFVRFQSLFSVAARRDFDDKSHLERALGSLQKYPAALPALGYLYAAQPAHIEKLLTRWSLTLRLGNVQKPLDVFREAPTAIPLAWRELLQTAPAAWQNAAQLAGAQKLLVQENSLPPGLRRVLDMPRKMENERAHLAARHAQTPRHDWAARLAMLERRLQNRAELGQIMAQEIEEKLQEIAAHSLLAAIEKQVSDCYRARLKEVAGPIPDDLILDDDWLNAVLLTADIESNRKLLRSLLRALLKGEINWHKTHPANVNFLQDLEARGVDTQSWLDTLPRRFHTAQGAFHFRLETQPLAILQMGNYFDTCLSFGGCNSFSTVANACELNKRVIFARDEKQRVVGRKLIGLNEDGKLIGFHTYTSLKDAQANKELRRTFARYCEIFAARCSLEMAQDGTIPRLFAEEWYDDGVVSWLYDDDKKGLASRKEKKRI